MAKTWTDQPDVLEEFPIISSFYATFDKNNAHMEIRKGEHFYYLSAGNLFGSQTIRCETADKVFEVINNLNKGISDRKYLPKGCDVLE